MNNVSHGFTLLHTNDHHNRFSAEQAERLRAKRVEIGPRGLLLDAGDAISAGNITYRPGGEPVLDLMNQTGYDAMTVGNREFHFSRAGFHSKLSRARFPVLCANVRVNRGPGLPEAAAVSEPEGDPPVRPWQVFILEGGYKVAVLGVTVPMITERMLVRTVSSYVFDDPLTIAESAARQLIDESAPDLMVALTHIGIRHDRALAERVPEFNLIIGGHTHVVLPEGERVGDTLIVQAGSHGRFLGRVTVMPGGRPTLSASLEDL